MGFFGFGKNGTVKQGKGEEEPKLTHSEKKTQQLISDFRQAFYGEKYKQIPKIGSKLAGRRQGAIVLEAIEYLLSKDSTAAIDAAISLSKTLLRKEDASSVSKAADLLEKFDPAYVIKGCMAKHEVPGHIGPVYSEEDRRYGADAARINKVRGAGKSLRSEIGKMLKNNGFFSKHDSLLTEMMIRHPN